MSDTVIKVENLSKKYLIAHQQRQGKRYKALRDVLAEKAKSLLQFGRNRNPKENNSREEFWALKDVSFEIKRGEAVGIIGRNGAGKSTLLKLLSRITEPTKGRIEMEGRVSSLLEVGTGFHPELTGRENIYLNGAILGMGRDQIRKQFDQIVAFSETEKFLDTPVKRYSSGMYMRLAFAVAAHLEPEILIVDEVLAVGDAQFQKKCIGKMQSSSACEGRTVLFVSHNLSAISQLCSRAIYLDKGSVTVAGSTAEVIKHYLNLGGSVATTWNRSAPVPSSKGIYFLSIRILVGGEVAPDNILTSDEFEVEMTVLANDDNYQSEISIRLTNQEGIAVLTTANIDEADEFQKIDKGKHIFRVKIPAALLADGTYTIQAAAFIPNQILFDCVDNELSLIINETGLQASSMKDHRPGVVNPRFPWY